jgi:uncharacterized membrane protein YraQ (UPF0718 family)
MAMADRARKGFIREWGGWMFLAVVAGLYGVAGIASPGVSFEALSAFGSLFVRVLPVLLLVFGLLFLASLFLERAWLVRTLERAGGIGGWALTILSGILSAGPLYAWYPLLGELKEKGVSGALIAAFLYSRALKLPLLPLMVHYFGLTYTIVLSAAIVVFSVVSGLLMKRFCDIEVSNRMEDHRK